MPKQISELACSVPTNIEHWNVERLIPYARNARTHTDEQVAQIAASIREFGFTNPLLVDSDAGIIAGHGRLLAARKLQLQEVPVIVLDHLSETQKRAYILVDNKLTENAGWDDELLRLELAALAEEDFDLDLIGFEADELSELMAEEPAGLTDEDDIPAPPTIPVTIPGDLWLLGPHRLICADSTSACDVERLLDGAQPGLMVTDPPYGIELDSEWRDRAGLNGCGAAEPSYMKKRTEGHTETCISGDTRADWSEAFELVPSLQAAYVWHASKFTREVLDGLLRIGFIHHQQIIWNKGRTVLTRTHYWFQHEPCWYVRKKNAPWFGEAGKNSTVWDSASPKFIMGGSDEQKYDHPTQKPVELMRRPILNHTKHGESVYEPFCGSGTTLMAAESTGRGCFAVELEPKYCDVIVKRWQAFSGKEATLDGNDRSFSDIARERVEA